MSRVRCGAGVAGRVAGIAACLLCWSYGAASAETPQAPGATPPATRPAEPPPPVWTPPPADRPSARFTQVFLGHTDGVEAVAVSPDGRLVASSGADKTARVWDTATGKQLHLLSGHGGHVVLVDFSGDGKRIVTGSTDHTARVWDTATGQLIAVLEGHQNHVHCQAISHDGHTVVTGSCDGTVRVWDADRRIEVLQVHLGTQADGVALSPDGRTIVTTVRGDETGSVRFYDARSAELRHSISLSVVPDDVGFVQGGRTLYVATVARGGKVGLSLYDTETYRLIRSVPVASHSSEARVSEDGKLALTIGPGPCARLWTLEGGKDVAILYGDTPTVNAVALSPDGRYAVAGTGGRGDPFDRDPNQAWVKAGDNAVTFADLQGSVPPLATIPLPAKVYARGTATSADGSRAAVVVSDGKVRVIDLRAGKLLREFPALADPVSGRCRPALSDDGSWLAVAQEKGLTVFDIATGRPVRHWEDPVHFPWSLAFLKGGRSLAVGTIDIPARSSAAMRASGQIHLLDLGASPDAAKSGAPAEAPAGAPAGWRDTSFKVTGFAPSQVMPSPDGRWLVVCDWDQTNNQPTELPVIDLKAAAGPREVRRIKPPGSSATSFQFAPDGRLFAVMLGEGGGCSFWDPATGERAGTLLDAPHLSWTKFSPDGKLLFVSSGAGDLTLWNVVTGRIKSRAAGRLTILGDRVVTIPAFPAGGEPRLLAVGSEQANLYPVRFGAASRAK